MAREVDPEGRRSIAIITKPDRVPDSEAAETRKLIRLVDAPPQSAAAAGAAAGGWARAFSRMGLVVHFACKLLLIPAAGSIATAAHSLRLGYYVVKNPGQEQLAAGISFEEARAAEARYFEGHRHWAPALQRHPLLKQRLGATALRSGLSALLVAQILQQLPEMHSSCRRQLNEVERELGEMPSPVANAPQVMSNVRCA
jgi:hypothetical protein